MRVHSIYFTFHIACTYLSQEHAASLLLYYYFTTLPLLYYDLSQGHAAERDMGACAQDPRTAVSLLLYCYLTTSQLLYYLLLFYYLTITLLLLYRDKLLRGIREEVRKYHVKLRAEEMHRAEAEKMAKKQPKKSKSRGIYCCQSLLTCWWVSFDLLVRLF